MPLDAFRIFKSPGDKSTEDPVQRRRAQVRKAQRTYQERKNAYAKSLEDALTRSKTREAALTQDNDRLRKFLASLAENVPAHLTQQIWTELSVPAPPAPTTAPASAVESVADSPSESARHRRVVSRDKKLPPVPPQQGPGSQTTSGFIFGAGSNFQLVPASALELSPGALSDGMLDLSSSGFLSSGYGSSPSHVSVPSPSSSANPAIPVTADPNAMEVTSTERSVDDNFPDFSLQRCTVDARFGSSSLGTYAETSVGMEFVLFLEKPCLAHIYGDPDSPHLSNGHALTVSSQVLAVSNSPPTTPPPDPLRISHTMSRAILTNLLKLAPQVNQKILEHGEYEEQEREVTPIQAWDLIRQHSQFKRIQVRRLRELLERLSGVAKCYGFGATFPARDFQKALTECIGYGFSTGT